jgi:hypothetical protein
MRALAVQVCQGTTSVVPHTRRTQRGFSPWVEAPGFSPATHGLILKGFLALGNN